MAVAVLITYFIALSVAILAGTASSFAGFLVFAIAAIVGVVLVKLLGKTTKG